MLVNISDQTVLIFHARVDLNIFQNFNNETTVVVEYYGRDTPCPTQEFGTGLKCGY